MTLFELGISKEYILDKTKVSLRTCQRLRAKALEAGWQCYPFTPPQPHHVSDKPRSRRLTIPYSVHARVLKCVTRNPTTRQWSCAMIAGDVSVEPGFYTTVSPSTVYRVLKQNGYKSYKRTIKPRLNQEQIDARYKWCLAYKD